MLPPRLPRLVAVPRCQSTGCESAQVNVNPAARPPLLLIATANPNVSLANVGSSSTSPRFQTTGLPSSSTWTPEQSGTRVLFSANPATSPRPFIATAWPLLPPSVGRALITPSCQMKGRHMRCVPKPQASSPFGSGVEVSAAPTTTPRSLTAKDPDGGFSNRVTDEYFFKQCDEGEEIIAESFR